MFDLLKIKLFGHQPVAKISDQLLDTLIERDYKSNSATVKTKLNTIHSDNQAGKNRIAAGILKLANKNFDTLDELIKKANTDSRDIFMWAEYPRCSKLGFDDLDDKQMKQIYLEDYIEYSSWLKV
ncbi:hypothetical protein ACFOW1_02155 [Parasediminibacterium paludis]|uniref:Uncharacterized protein n=1 Tax=Parasediminibacterium paludis TaxID=908966 RepID=A0ABV8PTU5_9BACT